VNHCNRACASMEYAVGTRDKGLRKSMKYHNSTLFCPDRFSHAQIVRNRNKERTRNKERFCVYQLLPYCTSDCIVNVYVPTIPFYIFWGLYHILVGWESPYF